MACHTIRLYKEHDDKKICLVEMDRSLRETITPNWRCHGLHLTVKDIGKRTLSNYIRFSDNYQPLIFCKESDISSKSLPCQIRWFDVIGAAEYIFTNIHITTDSLCLWLICKV